MDMKAFIEKAKYFDDFELEGYVPFAKSLEEEAEEIIPARLGLRAAVFADTHGYLAFDKNRLYDFLDTAGDFDLCFLLGDHHEEDLKLIADCIDPEQIMGVLGNHDPLTLYAEFGIRNISGSTLDIDGVMISGLGGAYRYKDEDMTAYLTQYESLELSGNFYNTDVLITHDTAFQPSYRDPAHAGLIGISRCIYGQSPSFHLHGHIHQPYSKPYSNGTVEKSVYLCRLIEL